MAEETEPAIKKPKMTETIDTFIDNLMNSKKNLQPVLNNEFYDPMRLIKVYVGMVKDVRELSKIITVLNEKMPLKELQHLKRARKKEVLLCPVIYLNTPQKSIQEFIELHLYDLRDSFEYFKVLGVPATPPKLKKQSIEFNKIWSCNFHPNSYYEKLTSGNFFLEHQIKTHRTYMGMAFEVVRYYLSQTNNNLELSDIILSDVNATVVVDPTINSVVAIAFDNRQNHPVQHSAMLAIDNVAKTQNGGAWDTAADIENVSERGIDKELLLNLKNKFPNVKYGARSYYNKEVLDENNMNAADSPYLCTGYWVYLIREPCFMCSMGLVHARANRVFFCLKNNNLGALVSKTKLQSVASLNHHFEVFTDFL